VTAHIASRQPSLAWRPARLALACLAGALLLTACAVQSPAAPQPAPLPRVGFLALGSQGLSGDVEPFREGLREQGYVEGQNVLVEYRFADGQADRLPSLVADLISLGVDVIVATSSPAIRAAMEATTTIPIVMGISANPVGQGFVASLAQPSGNVTGLTSLSLELSRKRLEVFKDALPTIERVVVLWNPNNSAKLLELQEALPAAEALGVQLLPLEVHTSGDLDAALTATLAERPDAVFVLGDPVLHQSHVRIAQFAASAQLPSMFESPELVSQGGLLAYGPKNADLFQRSAVYVDKILKGAKPSELPVERPTRFYLVINLKEAQAIGVVIPTRVLRIANEVVQ
jgi:putative ABC transport system substrate-binding protein